LNTSSNLANIFQQTNLTLHFVTDLEIAKDLNCDMDHLVAASKQLDNLNKASDNKAMLNNPYWYI